MCMEQGDEGSLGASQKHSNANSQGQFFLMRRYCVDIQRHPAMRAIALAGSMSWHIDQSEDHKPWFQARTPMV